MMHDAFDGEADIGSVRVRVEALLEADAPHIALHFVVVHDRGGFAVHFDCPEEERIVLLELLVGGGFRHVI